MKFTIQRSNSLLIYLVSVHCLAAVMISLITTTLILYVLAYLLCLFSLCVYLWRFGWLSVQYPLTVEIDNEGLWHIDTPVAQQADRYRLIGSVIFPVATIITLRSGQRRRSSHLVIMRDAIAAEPLRQLRVRLRHLDAWEK